MFVSCWCSSNLRVVGWVLCGVYDGRKVTAYTTHQWYVVLEVFCVVYVGKPPTQHVVVGLPTCVVGGGCVTRRKGVATRRKGVAIVFCSVCKLLKYNMVDTACLGNIIIQRINDS